MTRRWQLGEGDFVRLVGAAITFLMVAAIIQTVREFAIWRSGPAAFEEREVTDPRVQFGGHSVVISDDRGVDQGYSQASVSGHIALTIDGIPLGRTSYAQIRTHNKGLGRYLGWYATRIFRKRGTSDSVLYVARRLEDGGLRSVFEVTQIDARGVIDRRSFRGPQLTQDYRLFRTTQYLQKPWTAFPLSFAELTVMPPLLLVYPIAPIILGLVLLAHGRKPKRLRQPAGLDQTTI